MRERERHTGVAIAVAVVIVPNVDVTLAFGAFVVPVRGRGGLKRTGSGGRGGAPCFV